MQCRLLRTLQKSSKRLKEEANQVYTDYDTPAILAAYQYKMVQAWHGWHDNGTEITNLLSLW